MALEVCVWPLELLGLRQPSQTSPRATSWALSPGARWRAWLQVPARSRWPRDPTLSMTAHSHSLPPHAPERPRDP